MPRILVIDDDLAIGKFLKNYLTNNALDTSYVPSCGDALAILKTEKIDLVLTDILMPDKEGIETIKEIRNIAPQMKIIAMSGGGVNKPNAYLSYAKSFGANRAFAKPLDLTELLNAIYELLDGPSTGN